MGLGYIRFRVSAIYSSELRVASFKAAETLSLGTQTPKVPGMFGGFRV